MFDALRIVLYGLFNVYNDGENSQKGCGCITVLILLVFSGIFTLINESNISNQAKAIIYGIIIVILVAILIWMAWIELKKRRNKD